MNLIERAGLAVLHRMDPETAHGWSIRALRTGLVPMAAPVTTERLRTSVAGLDLPNPVGLAAGYDKNAEAIAPLQKAGFGFLEVGAATPRPQPGNPLPRLFRLTEDAAVINRFGFNNEGMDAIAERLSGGPRRIPVGLNLGANKDSEDRAADFGRVLARVGTSIDFATVNVSSPNTEKLRDLQGKAALRDLLNRVADVRDDAATGVRLFVKIAPDLSLAELDDVASVVASTPGLDGVIATNTTLSRDGLSSCHAGEAGGLSGAPLFERSTRVLAHLSGQVDKPIIGVGGIGSAEQAFEKIRAGASAVQLYSALVYGGLSLVPQITRGLDALLERGGFANISDAVGTGRSDWL